MAKEKNKRTVKIKVPSIWAITTGVLCVLLLVLVLQPSLLCTTGNVVASGMTADEAANEAIDWISDYYAASGVDVEIELVEASATENGIVEFTIDLTGGGDTATQTLYVTNDGKVFLPNAYETGATTTTTTTNPESACDSTPKSSDPTIDAFVVSYCPYGLQMQRILAEVVENIPSLEDSITVRYLGSVVDGEVTAMHGETEATENLLQICIREEQADKYWDYVSCFMKESDSTDTCLVEAGVDEDMLGECMTDSDRGVAYAQEDFDLQDQYGFTASPTLLMNGEKVSEFDFGGRTAEAVKMLLCCGFNSQPSECVQELTTESASTSFSPSYSGGSTSSGSC